MLLVALAFLAGAVGYAIGHTQGSADPLSDTDVGFMQEQPAAFRANKAGLSIDGSFRVGAYANTKDLQFGVGELPVHNNIKSNYASYWVNGISAKASGAKLDAAQKFLAFVTTADAMNLWLKTVGELPARVDAARARQLDRGPLNQSLTGARLREIAVPDRAGARLLAVAVDQYGLSARAHDRVEAAVAVDVVERRRASRAAFQRQIAELPGV